MNVLTPLRLAVPLAALAIATFAVAASPDDVLFRTPEVVITRADWDAELARIPNEQRLAFTTSPARVQAALNNLLVNRTLAVRAKAQALDKDPAVARRLAIESERFLAAMMVDRIETDAAAEFDRMTEKNEARARELFLVNESKYAVPEQIDVSHILFDVGKRGKDGALAAATEARARLVAGADFAALAKELSDDPSAAKNNGRLNGIARGKTDPAFEKAAFELKSPGDLSAPVLSRFGYHLIRLENRKPGRQRTFAEARPMILAEMRQKYVNDTRDAAVGAIRSDSRIEVNQPEIDALVVKIDLPAQPVPVPVPAKDKDAPRTPRTK
jgi:peptidyl-prolyl cis-trans isomerase C